MTKGFITIATGKKHYYKIAANLLLSYRFFSKNPLPFAIIAEEENEYTALFDDVIITTESTHSFMDKFLLLKLCPYDETIFFDADSLAYGDLNEYWSLFENATDFSAVGTNVPRESKEGAWYNVENIGKYGKNLPYKSRVHAGVCFIRKSTKNLKMYEDCWELYRNFDQMYFHTCPASKDECVFGVAMPMNEMLTVEEKPHMLAVYPCLTSLDADILNGKLSYTSLRDGFTEKCILLHWGTRQTYQPLYRFNVECLRYRVRYMNQKPPFYKKFWYQFKIHYWIMNVPFQITSFIHKYLLKLYYLIIEN